MKSKKVFFNKRLKIITGKWIIYCLAVIILTDTLKDVGWESAPIFILSLIWIVGDFAQIREFGKIQGISFILCFIIALLSGVGFAIGYENSFTEISTYGKIIYNTFVFHNIMMGVIGWLVAGIAWFFSLGGEQTQE